MLTLTTGSIPGVLDPGKRTMRAVLDTWGVHGGEVWMHPGGVGSGEADHEGGVEHLGGAWGG